MMIPALPGFAGLNSPAVQTPSAVRMSIARLVISGDLLGRNST
jgi:hypothetical protein